ncbi:MAG: hypothetical protein ABL925_15825, partial [Methylococcales bacterium]
MTNSLFTAHWYRVAKLKPQLHSHIEIYRHDYRGLLWYILKDTASGRNHRFNPTAYQFIGHLDGKRTVQEIYDLLSTSLADLAPSQEQLMQLLAQLHSADLIQTDVLVNTEELFARQARFNRTDLRQRLINPISQKFPLWDPENFLSRHEHQAAKLFTVWAAVFWVLVVIYAGLQAAADWPLISAYFAVHALEPYNFLSVFLLYAPIKTLHELGHAFAAKCKGAEVHEMGVNFLLFVPVPYVDVSSVGCFADKYARMLVSAAGILVETFLAALALLLFLHTEAGIVQSLAFNVFLIGGASSLFFNGNPLLKYDGYYLLADALEIPNLFQRAAQWWRYFLQRYGFGLRQIDSPATAPGETFWFIVYSVASTLYRLAMLWFIAVYVTEKFFSLGVLLAVWLATLQIATPIFQAIRFVISSPLLTNKRPQALISTLAVLVVAVALLVFVPMPSYTLAEGVAWLPDEAQIKTEQDGFIEAVQVNSQQFAPAGATVLRLYDGTLQAKAKGARAKLAELQSQYRAARETDLVKADIVKEELHIAEAEFAHLNNQAQALTVKTAKSGQVLLPDADDLLGRYVRHGELIGYILDENPPNIRMAVSQDAMGQLREGIVDIKIRLANALDQEYVGTIIRQAPQATNKLPSMALGTG